MCEDFQKHDEFHESLVPYLAVIVDNDISHILSECYWVLMVNSNLNNQIDKNW